MLAILIKAVAVNIHYHTALTVTRVLLDGLYIAAADFQLHAGAAVTERMEHNRGQVKFLNQSLNLLGDGVLLKRSPLSCATTRLKS